MRLDFDRDPLVITVAPTGAEVTRDDNPYVPHTPTEITAEVSRSYEAGATVCHLHIREPDGTPSAREDIWRETVSRVRSACPDIVVMVSTGGAITMNEEERLMGLLADPDMASLTTGTTNFGDGVFYNPLPLVRRFAARILDAGIQPELEVFDAGMIANAERVLREGIIRPPLHFNIMLGVPGALPGTPENLIHMIRSLPTDVSWSAAAVGRYQRQVVGLAVLLGGHVRVGFEDNVKLTQSQFASSNADFVSYAAGLARAAGRPLATTNQARDLLGVSRRANERTATASRPAATRDAAHS